MQLALTIKRHRRRIGCCHRQQWGDKLAARLVPTQRFEFASLLVDTSVPSTIISFRLGHAETERHIELPPPRSDDMPRYFFHMMDGRATIDTTGLYLENEGLARFEAVRAAGEMLADDEMSIWLGNEWIMSVVDEAGIVLFKLKISIEHPKRAPAMLS
jgi:hypothetical protein